MDSIVASIRVAVATMLFCVAGYTLVIWAVGQGLTPATANGSLISAPDGTVIGSRLIAQKFTAPRYFWPRPSAVDYNGAGAGGSNKSPTNPDLTKRGEEIVALYGATPERPLPAELAAASGGGLDPNISEHAALYQAPRVAAARGLPEGEVEGLVKQQAYAPGAFLASDRLVNVLELNLALDRLGTAQ
jgi:K+-transporting ATPase ATPase C chain